MGKWPGLLLRTQLLELHVGTLMPAFPVGLWPYILLTLSRLIVLI